MTFTANDKRPPAAFARDYGPALYARGADGAGQTIGIVALAGRIATSFVAPQINGSAAVIDSYLGRRTGFWNPAIYRFATEPGSPFTPLGATGTGNDNLYYTGTPGQTYNVGTGRRVPDLFRLAEDFALGQGGR